MGVLVERVFAVFWPLPWQSKSAPAPSDVHGVLKEWPTAPQTRLTGWEHAPSSSVLRPDLEALRRHP
jgi:hypothetical protein